MLPKSSDSKCNARSCDDKIGVGDCERKYLKMKFYPFRFSKLPTHIFVLSDLFAPSIAMFAYGTGEHTRLGIALCCKSISSNL